MRAAARWFFALGLFHPLGTSLLVLSEDVGGSGSDLEGSGAEDWSDQGEITAMKDGTGSKDQTSGITYWPSIDFQSEVIIVGKSKSFLENQDITNGLIAGGVIGAILAALLSALIYTWERKHGGGFILGKLVHREEADV